MKHLRWYMTLWRVIDNETSKVVHDIVEGK